MSDVLLLCIEFWNESRLALGAQYDISSMFHFVDGFKPFPFIPSLERSLNDVFPIYLAKSTNYTTDRLNELFTA